MTMAFPLPQTRFHDIVEREGLLQTDDIYSLMIHERVRVGGKPHVRTRELSAAELERGWKEIRKQINRYYFVKNVVFRPWDMRKVVTGIRSPRDMLALVPKAGRFAIKHLTGSRG